MQVYDMAALHCFAALGLKVRMINIALEYLRYWDVGPTDLCHGDKNCFVFRPALPAFSGHEGTDAHATVQTTAAGLKAISGTLTMALTRQGHLHLQVLLASCDSCAILSSREARRVWHCPLLI